MGDHIALVQAAFNVMGMGNVLVQHPIALLEAAKHVQMTRFVSQNLPPVHLKKTPARVLVRAYHALTIPIASQHQRHTVSPILAKHVMAPVSVPHYSVQLSLSA
jgi:hypothetical protein